MKNFCRSKKDKRHIIINKLQVTVRNEKLFQLKIADV